MKYASAYSNIWVNQYNVFSLEQSPCWKQILLSILEIFVFIFLERNCKMENGNKIYKIYFNTAMIFLFVYHLISFWVLRLLGVLRDSGWELSPPPEFRDTSWLARQFQIYVISSASINYNNIKILYLVYLLIYFVVTNILCNILFQNDLSILINNLPSNSCDCLFIFQLSESIGIC